MEYYNVNRILLTYYDYHARVIFPPLLIIKQVPSTLSLHPRGYSTLNCYVTITLAHDIDDGICDYSHFGNTVYRPKIRWINQVCTDLIKYNVSEDNQELRNRLSIGNIIDSKTKE